MPTIPANVQNGINGNAGLTNISNYPFMIGIIAAVCGQVKSDGESFLTRGQVPPVKSIGFLGC